MMNILVVEDDQFERSTLVRMLKASNRDIKIFEAATGGQAIRILEQETIELFFLDIELPDMSVVEIAEKIRSISQYELTYIVFVITHVYYQLEALKKYHYYNFIEKPYKQEDILKISHRLIKGVTKGHIKEQAVRFKIKNYILKIFLKDILFIESQGKNCMIHTKNNQYIIPNISMKGALRKLESSSFMQTHKSYIVNFQNIHLIERYGKNAWIVHFKDYALAAYVSNKYKKEFLNRFLPKG
ncbi:LytR/AlgR family response regulator transcription factor [Clostridium formicaceticum]|uniref:Stage 0 sporulation protein A homolog n=1 Tax=Clostridium formicaceticum TaxID=1497 RepID=A0AAC9RMU9_9CLOT|nr:LytTR family DNA-binding domain-containing protein [Clostridium formicaceticum]AOY77580.1 DNA-binding response regulator [Clostridium formicaceticum]ARE88158.1 Transcriptional regulatory protein YpdB [Clostridium formicaceticum]